MSTLLFYQEQAAQQTMAADAATLANVRDRCQRAADAWTNLAARSERANAARLARPETAAAAPVTADKLVDGMSENPDRGYAEA